MVVIDTDTSETANAKKFSLTDDIAITTYPLMKFNCPADSEVKRIAEMAPPAWKMRGAMTIPCTGPPQALNAK